MCKITTSPTNLEKSRKNSTIYTKNQKNLGYLNKILHKKNYVIFLLYAKLPLLQKKQIGGWYI